MKWITLNEVGGARIAVPVEQVVAVVEVKAPSQIIGEKDIEYARIGTAAGGKTAVSETFDEVIKQIADAEQ